jgi:PIN domain nuclease of toxin-antitoxin system
MGPVVADTHALLWSMYEPEKLSKAALAAFQDAVAARQPVYLSAISIVEICYLVEKGKLAAHALDQLIEAIEGGERGLAVASLDQAVAEAVGQIPRRLVPDMPDRIIAATAFHLGLPLVTRDAQIRSANITTIW